MGKKIRSKSTLILPPGNSGEFLLTPKIAKETDSHVTDLERLIRKRGDELGEDLWMQMTVTSRGMKLTWGPASELEIEENETDAFGQEVRPSNDNNTEEIMDYLDRKAAELAPSDHTFEEDDFDEDLDDDEDWSEDQDEFDYDEDWSEDQDEEE